MDQRISFITLGVQNLDLMKTWYIEGFGWKPIRDEDGICFFRMNGCILALFPFEELAEDIGVSPQGSGFKRFSLAINLLSEEEVNSKVDHLRNRGARVIKAPEKVFWGGYRGYIADPEDNYWELAYNPFMSMDEKGNVVSG